VIMSRFGRPSDQANPSPSPSLSSTTEGINPAYRNYEELLQKKIAQEENAEHR
jgi:hypothetical protein